MPIRQHLWGDLPHAFRRNTPHAIGPAASSCSRGFPQEGSKVRQSAQKRRSADRFCCILPVVFKISTKICLFLCVVCEWTNDAPSCIIKPETREVQQKLKWELIPLTWSRKERDRWSIWNPHSRDRLSGFAEKQNRGSPQTGCFPRIKTQQIRAVLEHQHCDITTTCR